MKIPRLKMNARHLLASLFCLVFSMYGSQALAGTIVNSVHNLSGLPGTSGQICVVCHTPHGGDPGQAAPLWNHTITATVFTPYSSPTFDGAATIGDPAGVSRLCLSCHDGTVALDAFGGAPGTIFMGPPRNIGADGIANDHPISFDYEAARALDGGLNDSLSGDVIIGDVDQKTGTIDAVMLIDGKVECASCHDVHNKYAVVNTPLLRITYDQSAICLTCHVK
jgi:hypothetical protein